MQTSKFNEDLIFENQLLHEIIENIHEAIYVVNAQDQVVIFNHEMERIEGLHQQDTLGKQEQDVYRFVKGPSYNQVVTQKIKRHGKSVFNQVYTYNLSDGRDTNFIYDAHPFYFKNKLAAVYSIGRNLYQLEDFIAKTIELTNQISQIQTKGNVARFFLDDIIGHSKSIREAVRLSRKVAVRSSPVLIYGHTGTGKELFAQGIHNASMFAQGPFVAVNCAAIPETLLEATLFGTVKGAFTGATDIPGIFEQAQSGSVFLDEINSMPQHLQAKLLRVLQEKVVRRLGGKEDMVIDCRIISACNEDPYVGESIRKDFLYRISTILISVAPLKDRTEDIAELAGNFIQKYNHQFGLFVRGISPPLEKAFMDYHWPGNVRELENMIETAMNMVEPQDYYLEPRHLPLYIRERLNLKHIEQEDMAAHLYEDHLPHIQSGTLKDRLWEFEKKILQETLRKHGGNVTRAAVELGIQRQNLHYRIRRFGLKESDENSEKE